MATKLYISRRTDHHIINRLDSSYNTDATFGVDGTPKTDNTGLNFPWGIAADPSDNIYVCDGNNQRIVKLNSGLSYVSNVDVSSEVGIPYAIFYDTINSELYVVGVYNNQKISVARITTALSITKYDNDVYAADTNDRPMGISRAFGGSDFLISGQADLLRVTEGGSDFGTASTQTITGEDGTHFVGHVKHSNGDLYLISSATRGSKIHRVNSSYVNIGDSDRISKSAFKIVEGLGNDILIFNSDDEKLMRYDQYLNFEEDIFINSPAPPTPSFTVNPGQNVIDFDHGIGPQAVIIPPGPYDDVTLAAAIKFALDTAVPPVPNTYTVTYGTTIANHFDIIQDIGGTGLFNLLLLAMPVSGPPASIGPTIGFLTDHLSPPGIAPGPPHTGDVPVGAPPPPSSTDAEEIYGIVEIDV